MRKTVGGILSGDEEFLLITVDEEGYLFIEAKTPLKLEEIRTPNALPVTTTSHIEAALRGSEFGAPIRGVAMCTDGRWLITSTSAYNLKFGDNLDNKAPLWLNSLKDVNSNFERNLDTSNEESVHTDNNQEDTTQGIEPEAETINEVLPNIPEESLVPEIPTSRNGPKVLDEYGTTASPDYPFSVGLHKGKEIYRLDKEGLLFVADSGDVFKFRVPGLADVVQDSENTELMLTDGSTFKLADGKAVLSDGTQFMAVILQRNEMINWNEIIPDILYKANNSVYIKAQYDSADGITLINGYAQLSPSTKTLMTLLKGIMKSTKNGKNLVSRKGLSATVVKAINDNIEVLREYVNANS